MTKKFMAKQLLMSIEEAIEQGAWEEPPSAILVRHTTDLVGLPHKSVPKTDEAPGVRLLLTKHGPLQVISCHHLRLGDFHLGSAEDLLRRAEDRAQLFEQIGKEIARPFPDMQIPIYGN